MELAAERELSCIGDDPTQSRRANVLLMTADDMDASLPGFMGGTQKLLGTIADARSPLSGDATSRSLSLAVPVGRYSRFWVNTGQLKPKAGNADQSLLGLGYRHGLSSRTWLFVSGARAKLEGQQSTKVVSTGITHFF